MQPHNRGVSLKNLRKLFFIAMRHFEHNAEQQAAAWAAARDQPYKALKCYQAIVNSLGIKQ